MRNDREQVPAGLRLDKWLWFARLARTRSVAARLCSDGRVIVGAHPATKPHQLVRIGDVVVVELARQRRHLVVRALGERRGPFTEARQLYDEPTPPVSLRETEPGWSSLFDAEDERSDVSA
jgi:ribosome-associated heat shock protein Hsp15